MPQHGSSDSKKPRRQQSCALTLAAGCTCTVGTLGFVSRRGADSSTFLSPATKVSTQIGEPRQAVGKTAMAAHLGSPSAYSSSCGSHVVTFFGSSAVAAAAAMVSSRRRNISQRQICCQASNAMAMDVANGPAVITPAKGETLDIHVYACGLPKKGMGWYHADQLLDGRFSNAKLAHVVEPFFLNLPNGSPEFESWKVHAEPQGVSFHNSVEDAPLASPSSVVLISGRTSDNPKLFQAALDKGFKNIILEKPGASTLVELIEMAQHATAHGASVYMGYNRNFSKYVKKLVQKSIELESQGKTIHVTLGRNDCFSEDALDECFERNAEGMLANMMCHELMVLVTYFGLTASAIKEITVDATSCTKEVRRGQPDFRQMCFTIAMDDGRTFRLWGDRCGGEYCEALIAVDGSEVFRALRPDPTLEAMSKKLELEKPGCQPYFYLQDEEYLDLKEAIFTHIQEGNPGSPHGVARIDTAVEAMKVIEVIQGELDKAVP